MKLTRCGDAPTKPAPAENFSGTVWQNPIITAEAPARVVAVSVTFTPGGRTNWHEHPLGQTLYVTSGCGWYQTEGEARVTIRPGDVVWIPPGEKHWHGATDTTMMTHVAIAEFDAEAGTHNNWLEPVTDEQYLAG